MHSGNLFGRRVFVFRVCDLLGWERIQRRQEQTRQEHQEGEWDGGEKGRIPHRKTKQYLHSFLHSFIPTAIRTYRRADEHNTQRLEMGMQGRGGGDSTEQSMGSEWEDAICVSRL